MNRPLIAALGLAILSAAATQAAPPPPYVAQAISDPGWSKAETATDAARDPADTLVFSGVKLGMVVGADDHTLSIFDPDVQGKTDQYALRFVRPWGWSHVRGDRRSGARREVPFQLSAR